MDLATVIGMVGGSAVIIVSMLLAGNLMMFWDFLSLIIVMGGATFATMMRWSLKGFISGFTGISRTIQDDVSDPQELIDEIFEISTTARKESILALEKVAISNDSLAKCVKLMVDGQDITMINEIIDIDIESSKRRIRDASGVLDDMGEGCPAFGMIGTVIGLIVIMANLSDPNAIGPGLAVALVTTLYGSLIANMVFIPLAAKVRVRGSSEVTNLKIIKGGVNSILAGENPRAMREKLESFLDDVKPSADAA